MTTKTATRKLATPTHWLPGTRHPWPQDHYLTPYQDTPFTPRLKDLCWSLDWYSWSGYLALNTVQDTELEYAAIRNAATLFDISPMTKYRISGPDAEAFLDRLTVRSVAKQTPGTVRYTAWCNEDGHVLDDGTLYRMSETEFRLCCQERQLSWLIESSLGFDVTVTDETDAIAGLALQGPTSFSVLKAAGFKGLDTLKPFGMVTVKLGRTEVLVSRTGFTGDLGYELFVTARDALKLWDALWDPGQLFGLRATGFSAVNLARLEAGFIMAQTDFVPAAYAIRANRPMSPYELGLGWMVDLNTGFFNGRAVRSANCPG
ncbi:MAG: aminomethyltransferase family protein [Pseudomonadota bacterium]